MLYSGTDPEPYITEYTVVYENNPVRNRPKTQRKLLCGDPLRNSRTHYRGTSLMRNCLILETYSRPMPRAL